MSAPGARLAAAFARRRADDLPGLVAYVTAGYPRLSDTPDLLKAAERAGCIAAEVGIPFSDPLADGPTIQRSSHQALSNGITVNRALDHVASARGAGVSLPLALMTYVNPVLSYGSARFCADAAAAGADALIVPDLPAGEAGELQVEAERSGLALIFMLAPTTTEARLREACARGSGFVYCVSVTGITGARSHISEEAFELLARVGRFTDLPRALGFGLSRHEHLEALRGHAEAAVVASALIDAIAVGGDDPVGVAERFLAAMLRGGTG
ncbi:MAG TPA: tryptophan synthase subunit alpha [Candidatus Dormibacteraeota bacterium]|nr:tryptophan synthase subunit alpha [Candidatus Dormibacteraeota bacterium]